MTRRSRGINSIPAEAREFQGHRAGVVSRTLACVIDLAVTVAVLTAAYVGVASLKFLLDPRGFTLPPLNWVHAVVVGGTVLFVYLAVSWMATGRSYGGRVFGLRVVSFRGRKLNFATAVLRSGACVLFPIGLFWCVVSNQNRSVQDIVLRTSVIYDWLPRNAETHD